MKNRLEELRKQRGLKQEDLANALEVSRQTIGSLENGRYNPSIQLAFKIARYFDMSIEEIFIYEEDGHPQPECLYPQNGIGWILPESRSAAATPNGLSAPELQQQSESVRQSRQ